MPRKQHDHHNLGGSNKLLSLTEAAALLGKPPESLRKYRTTWGIPWLKVGRDVKFRERDLNAWMEKRMVAS